MRILFLSKRHPQQRDLIERPYGRFHHLPEWLARSGHEVRVQLCSFRNLASLTLRRNAVDLSSHDIRTLGLRRFWQAVRHEALAFRPDWVIGCSDTWTGVLAARLARVVGARCAIDAYDNYESYMPWNMPLHWAWRHTLRRADLVTAAGPHLALHLQSFRVSGRIAQVLPMAADPGYVPLKRDACRAEMGLPADGRFLGYLGSWGPSRGTAMLLEALAKVRDRRPEVRLLVSGRPPVDVRSAEGVIPVGYLKDAQLPRLVAALDVACVVTAETTFGRYSYPAKLCEAMACGVPVVATATAPVSWMLGHDRRFLAAVADAKDFSDKVLSNLDRGHHEYHRTVTWQQVGQRLNELLMDERNDASVIDATCPAAIDSEVSPGA